HLLAVRRERMSEEARRHGDGSLSAGRRTRLSSSCRICMSKARQFAMDDRTKVRSSMMESAARSARISTRYPWMTELCGSVIHEASDAASVMPGAHAAGRHQKAFPLQGAASKKMITAQEEARFSACAPCWTSFPRDGI